VFQNIGHVKGTQGAELLSNTLGFVCEVQIEGYVWERCLYGGLSVCPLTVSRPTVGVWYNLEFFT
jgi:hypothetical protein